MTFDLLDIKSHHLIIFILFETPFLPFKFVGLWPKSALNCDHLKLCQGTRFKENPFLKDCFYRNRKDRQLKHYSKICMVKKIWPDSREEDCLVQKTLSMNLKFSSKDLHI